MQKVITDDLNALLDILPPHINQPLCEQEDHRELLEVVLDLGRPPEARFPQREAVLNPQEVSEADIDYLVAHIGSFGDDKSRRRLGDIMNHAKLYLLTQVGVSGAGVSESNAINELAMWHVIGDPTLEIWTENPNPNPLPGDFTFKQEDGSAIFEYTVEGATVTVYQVDSRNEFVPIGRASVVDGRATIDYFQRPVRGVDLILSVTAQNAVSRLLTPRTATFTTEKVPSSSPQ